MLNVARTTLSSKILYHEKDYFSNMAVDAVSRLKVVFFFFLVLTCKGGDIESIHVLKKTGGSLRSSFLEEG